MTEQCKRASCTRREEQMRARIAELEAENRDACIGLNDYYGKRIAELEKQLAAHEAVINKMQEALKKFRDSVLFRIGSTSPYRQMAREYFEFIRPLVDTQPTTEHLDAYVKELIGEPVAWLFSDNFGEHHTDDRRDWYDGVNIESVTPLYALKEQK